MTIASILMKDTLVHDGYVFGTNTNWSLWIGKQPKFPDQSITIYDTGGRPPNPRWLLDYPSVQVRIRGGQNDYELASQKAFEVRNRLLGRESYNAYDGLGDRIVMINGIGDVGFVGWSTKDDLVRPEFVFSLSLIIEPSPTTTPTNREPL